MKEVKSYIYTNKLGRRKKLIVYLNNQNENGFYNILIDMATGEFCGSNYFTEEETADFLKNYEFYEEEV